MAILELCASPTVVPGVFHPSKYAMIVLIFQRAILGKMRLCAGLACCLAAVSPARAEDVAKGAKPAPRIAVLPSLSESGSHGSARWWLAGFDAALQAELLKNWNVVMLSRAGLSNVVFEQKLALANGKSDLPPQVPAADHLVFSILDTQRRELRMHVMQVSDDMKLTPARIFQYNDFQDLGGSFAKSVAAELGKQLRLDPAEKSEAKPPAADTPLKVALLNPIAARSVKASISQIAPVLRANLEIALAEAPFPVELVERERVDALMEELALGESGAAEANGAARFGTLAGADLILMPYIHPASGENIHVTVLAIESGHGRIVAGRSWTGGALEAPPETFLAALSTEAITRRAAAVPESPGGAAMRNAEAVFLTGLRNASMGLRLPAVVEAELCLTWADAALALSHDNRETMRDAAVGLLFYSIPFYNQLALKYHAPRERVADHIEDVESGIIGELRLQARRIFTMPLMDLTTDGNTTDLARVMTLHLRTGDPQAALSFAENQARPLDELLTFFYFRACYAETLIELGRFRDCAALLHNVPYKDLRYGAFSLRLDAYRAVGDKRREFESLWFNAKDMDDFRETDMARFFEIGPDFVTPDRVLTVYGRFAGAWRRDTPLIREPLVRLRIKAGQTEHAISDAQCAYLSYRLEDDKDGMQRMADILKDLKSALIEALPRAAEFIRLLPNTRFDLIHDRGVPAQRAAATARLLATQWGCEVHVIPLDLDITRLSTYRQLARSVDGSELADCLSYAARKDDPLLQTIVLTSAKLHTGTAGEGGADIFGQATHFGATEVISTYYFERQSRGNRRLVEEDLVIASSPEVVSMKLRNLANEKKERFVPMPPDMMATSIRLGLSHRLPGVSPDTGRLMAEVEPEEWKRAAIDARNKLSERLAGDPPPNAAEFRALAAKVSATPVTIIQPEK